MRFILFSALLFTSVICSAQKLSSFVQKSNYNAIVDMRYKLVTGDGSSSEGDGIGLFYRDQFNYYPSRGLRFSVGAVVASPQKVHGETFSVQPVFLDTLNLSYSLSPRLRMSAGRMKTPYQRGQSSVALFDDDLRLDGLHLGYRSRRNKKGQFNLDASVFFVPLASAILPQRFVILGLQGDYNGKVAGQKLRAGAGAYYTVERNNFFKDFESQSAVGELFADVQLSMLPLNVYLTYAPAWAANNLSTKGNLLLDANIALGLRYTLNRKFSGNYNFTIPNMQTPFAQFMDSDLIAGSDAKSHSLAVNYNLSKTQTFVVQLILRQESLSKKPNSTTFILSSQTSI